MSPHHVAALALLAFGVAIELVCCIGLLRAGNVFDRLHFLGPASTVGPAAILGFVLLRYGAGPAGIKTIVLTVALIVFGPVLTHATARAGRVREFDRWQILDEERVE